MVCWEAISCYEAFSVTTRTCQSRTVRPRCKAYDPSMLVWKLLSQSHRWVVHLIQEAGVQGTTYRGRLTMQVCVRRAAAHGLPTGEPIRVLRSFGQLPIMLQSRLCHLRAKSRNELVRLKEARTPSLCASFCLTLKRRIERCAVWPGLWCLCVSQYSLLGAAYAWLCSQVTLRLQGTLIF